MQYKKHLIIFNYLYKFVQKQMTNYNFEFITFQNLHKTATAHLFESPTEFSYIENM